MMAREKTAPVVMMPKRATDARVVWGGIRGEA